MGILYKLNLLENEMDIYNAEKTYKHGETCLYEGIVYRATCAMIDIAPIEDSIGTFWLVDEENGAQGVVHGLNP